MNDFIKLTISQIKKLAVDNIKTYFISKKLYSGGGIPNLIFKDDKTIKRIITTDLETACIIAHNTIGFSEEEKNQVERHGGIYNSTDKILKIIEECAKLKIPQEFIPGIILLHLELCDGYRLEQY